MTAKLHQIALREKWQGSRGVTRQNLRSVSGPTGTP